MQKALWHCGLMEENHRRIWWSLRIFPEFSITQSPSIQDCPVQNGIRVDNSSSPYLNLCFALGSLTLEVIEERF